jgi:hypothetical protein
MIAYGFSSSGSISNSCASIPDTFPSYCAQCPHKQLFSPCNSTAHLSCEAANFQFHLVFRYFQGWNGTNYVAPPIRKRWLSPLRFHHVELARNNIIPKYVNQGLLRIFVEQRRIMKLSSSMLSNLGTTKLPNITPNYFTQQKFPQQKFPQKF